MPRRLDFKLIFSLTILIVAISCISGYLNFRMQKDRLVEAMILGADQLSRSITSATWHAMLDVRLSPSKRHTMKFGAGREVVMILEWRTVS